MVISMTPVGGRCRSIVIEARSEGKGAGLATVLFGERGGSQKADGV